MNYIGPKLRVYFKTKGYTDLPFYVWDSIEKFFDLLWQNSTYSITVDYCYIEKSLKILDIKGYRGKDGLSLGTFFLANNDWDSILPVRYFIHEFIYENSVLEQKEAGRILIKLNKNRPIYCTLIA